MLSIKLVQVQDPGNTWKLRDPESKFIEKVPFFVVFNQIFPLAAYRELNSQAAKVFLTSDLCENRYLCFLVESHQHLRSVKLLWCAACTNSTASSSWQGLFLLLSVVFADVWSLWRATTRLSSSLPPLPPSLPKMQSLCRYTITCLFFECVQQICPFFGIKRSFNSKLTLAASATV